MGYVCGGEKEKGKKKKEKRKKNKERKKNIKMILESEMYGWTKIK